MHMPHRSPISFPGKKQMPTLEVVYLNVLSGQRTTYLYLGVATKRFYSAEACTGNVEVRNGRDLRGSPTNKHSINFYPSRASRSRPYTLLHILLRSICPFFCLAGEAVLYIGSHCEMVKNLDFFLKIASTVWVANVGGCAKSGGGIGRGETGVRVGF